MTGGCTDGTGGTGSAAAVDGREGGKGDDELVHDARKAAKRARYVAELAEPEVGSAARATVRRMTAAQDHLGGQQDDAVARRLLLELMTEGLPPDVQPGPQPGASDAGTGGPAADQDDGVRQTLDVLYARLGPPR